MSLDHTFKLFEFNVYNSKGPSQSSDEDEEGLGSFNKDNTKFAIQMFGINEKGEKASILVEEYQPFFYLKVGDKWTKSIKEQFITHLKTKVGKYYEDSIVESKLIEKKKLYGFDAGKLHRFIMIKFANVPTYNKVKNFWYKDSVNSDGEKERGLIPNGFWFKDCHVELYEANIPPLLRFFHLREISPSGWVALPAKKCFEIKGALKTTTCDYEFSINYKNIVPLNDKESRVPYKIMSFDIEASSSHGDFPVPIKSYKKLATNIVDYFVKMYSSKEITYESCKAILSDIIRTAFNLTGDKEHVPNIDLVYYKGTLLSRADLDSRIEEWLKTKIRDREDKNDDTHLIEALFENANKALQVKDKEDKEEKAGNNNDDGSDSDSDSENGVEEPDDEPAYFKPNALALSTFKTESYKNRQSTIVDIMCDKKFEREGKINELIFALRNHFPQLEGDKVTFIGSTFVRYGEKEPYLNHCIALNSCDSLDGVVPNSQIETYNSEKEVLNAWTKLVQKENPDIIIGYNIFSFDYEFMFRRSQELGCAEDFLKLSRNKDELCATIDYKTQKMEIDKSSITLASGTYDLSIIKMNGRLQVDMLNWFRRTENLTSYKLDYVGGHFIGDYVKKLEHQETGNTRIYTVNMTGLQTDSFIHFEEINHSSDYYKDGAKFRVSYVNKTEGWFEVDGHENPKAKAVKWGLAKDDVSPKDIFRMTNEGPSARAVIAKYCIQDCNLVQHLFSKVDVVTDLVEMAKLCSVPMSFLIFRGQGIKLTSYVAKKCREKGVLMPVINKGSKDDGYEGAIVLEPKCGLYLDNPIAVGDFASLYPSSMLSENLCPSSKVWTKIYDLAGNLVTETGQKNDQKNDHKSNEYLYDNLPGYEYVDIRFDTYRYHRKNPKARAEKIKNGYKLCRFAQPLHIKTAPGTLGSAQTLGSVQTLESTHSGVLEKAIMPSILQELLKARKDTRKMIEKTDDDFMKNVLDKRQLAYKVTANSLYGQLGAKTSTFYEPDIAASTTATGRLLLTYAKRVVEECYGDATVDSKYGLINTKAEYVYGDTDSVFFTFNLQDKETGDKIIGTKALELSIEIAKEACHNVSKFLKQPHDFEYEKTFLPFCLLSKKRYVGILYEHDPNKGKRKEMGIVLKRRDNAPIVKDVYGGVIDILMKDRDIKKALDYVDKCLQELVDGTVPIDKLIITKSLRSFYKNPQQIAHKVLADRIGAREPGNKPTSGDRVPFVYIVNPNKKALQGEKIETPTFIRDNKLQIDYSFYITNQIMKPLLQLFGLVLEDIWMSQKPPRRAKVTNFRKEIDILKRDFSTDSKKCEDKIAKLKDKEVKALIFDKYLRETNNVKEGNQSVTNFFHKK
jgi:DNA polymerase elongation subunit (family B)